MTVKVLILLCVAFSLGEAREIAEPESSFDEKYLNLGPTSIHSVKGKFYEERVIRSNPDKSYHVTRNSKPDVNIASELQDILTKIADREQSKEGERILFRRNKDKDASVNSTLDHINAFNSSKSNFKNNDSMDEQAIKNSNRDINKSPKIHFHAEKVISGRDENKTIETIKRELAFESLLIKNDYNDIGNRPENITNTSKSQEINPKVVTNPDSLVENIFENPDILDEPNRRLGYTNNVPFSNPLQTPIINENNFVNVPSKTNPRNNDNNLTNIVVKPDTLTSSKQRGEVDVIPISPKFEHQNYDKRLPSDMGANTPVRQNYYNIIDKNTCDDNESDETEQSERSGNDILPQEPIKGHGITTVVKSRTPVMLMDHPRVCYACSSINDLTCWSPDRSTSVKYCRGDHPSCITKHFKYKGLSYVIRDCGNTCERNALSGGPIKYSACTICHQDLCNTAFHFKIQNVVVVFLIFHLLYVVKVSVN